MTPHAADWRTHLPMHYRCAIEVDRSIRLQPLHTGNELDLRVVELCKWGTLTAPE